MTRTQLTDAQRSRLRQRYIAGDRIIDIAAEFGVVHGTVRYHCADLPPREIRSAIKPDPIEPVVSLPVPDDDNVMVPPGDWTKDAACARHPDPDLWFGANSRYAHKAKEVCAGCPVIEKCAEYALSVPTDQLYGVWAGLSRHDRRRIVAERNAEASAA